MVGDGGIRKPPEIYNGILENCVVKLSKIKCLNKSGDSNISLLNSQRPGDDFNLNVIKKSSESIPAGNEISGDATQGIKNQASQCVFSVGHSPINTIAENDAPKVSNFPHMKFKRCAVRLPRLNLEGYEKNLNKSVKSSDLSHSHENKLKRYKVKIESGNISFTVAKENTPVSKQENKENIQKKSQIENNFCGESKMPTNRRRPRRKLYDENAENKTPALSSKNADIFSFDSEKITDNDKTADVIQKMIKEGRAAVVKYRHQAPKKKIEKKTTLQLLQGIRRNLLKNQNILTGRSKSKDRHQNKDVHANASYVDHPQSHQLEYFDNDDVDMAEPVIDNFDESTNEGAISEIHTLEGSPKVHGISTEAERTCAALNPKKAVKVLEVIYLPNRATALPRSTPSIELTPKEPTSSRKLHTLRHVHDDTGLDITHANCFDFLGKLDEEKAESSEHILQESDELDAQSNFNEDTTKTDNSVGNDALTELDNTEVEADQNDSLFPDVNVTPFFETTAQRKTYGQPRKNRERETRFFILFSDDEEKKHPKPSTIAKAKAQRTVAQDLENTIEKISPETGGKDVNEELNEKENVKPQLERRSKHRRGERKIEPEIDEIPVRNAKFRLLRL